MQFVFQARTVRMIVHGMFVNTTLYHICPALPRQLSALRVFHSKSSLYGGFCVDARGA